LQPVAADDADHIGEVHLPLPAPLLNGDEAHAGCCPDGVLGERAAHPYPGADLSDGAVTVSVLAHLVSNDAENG
jgi:hypothetical protein